MSNTLPNTLLPVGHATERLTFDLLSKSDIDTWMSFFSDDDVHIRFLGLDSLAPKQLSEQWIDKQLGRYENGNGLMALRDKENGELIGQCGILHQELDGEEVLEIGYHILSQYRHKGYASEAARECRRYLFDNDLAVEVYSIIQEDNELSCKVAHRNGMLPDRETSYQGLKVKVYKAEKYLKKISFGEYLGMGFVICLVLILIGWLIRLMIG